MKRFLPYLILLLAGLYLGTAWITPKPKEGDFDVRSFSRLPVLVGGRIKPLDTVARNALLIMRGKQTLRLANSSPMAKPMDASRWLADVLFNAPVADTYPVFAIANQEVLGMCGLPQEDKRYCTYAELQRSLEKIDDAAQRASAIEAIKRTPFQSAIHNLRNSLYLYQQLKNSIQPDDTRDFTAEINAFASAVAKGAEAAKKGEKSFDKDLLDMLRAAVSRYETQSQFAYMLTVAPPAGGKPSDWLTTGAALLQVDSLQAIPPSVTAYAAMGDAFRAGNHAGFAQAAGNYLEWVHAKHPEWTTKTVAELHFNQMEPFYQGMILYVGAFLLVLASWLILPKEMRAAAFLVLALAFTVHTFGMVSRMWLQGRPPVTNLYSSAIFVGWGAVAMAMGLEGFFRYGIALACACVVGFVTLIIAHHLGASGDTLEMMTAVLDSNKWLATHVVVITLGYAAMFLAGGLAVFYVLLDLLTCTLDRTRLAKRGVLILAPVFVVLAGALVANKVCAPESRELCGLIVSFLWLISYATLAVVLISFGLVIALDFAGLRRLLLSNQGRELATHLGRVFSRMVYGILCFATLFSFVGTVLGGIWADQSWGRFWGWDPKENGALLIVLWCALTLHARWGGFIRQRGLMAMAIGGNAITAFSWFGVNMLGVGLHSYGFMDKAFPWLAAFVGAQAILLIISLQKTSHSPQSTISSALTPGA